MTHKTFVKDKADDSIGDTLLRRLRFEILRTRLPPCERLRQERMRETCGAGVTALREMPTRLVVEGLVIAEGDRGFVVSPVGEADLRDICELRPHLECPALSRSIEAGTLSLRADVVAAPYQSPSVEAMRIGRRPRAGRPMGPIRPGFSPRDRVRLRPADDDGGPLQRLRPGIGAIIFWR